MARSADYDGPPARHLQARVEDARELHAQVEAFADDRERNDPELGAGRQGQRSRLPHPQVERPVSHLAERAHLDRAEALLEALAVGIDVIAGPI